jgi:hypothetical protein
MSITTPVKYSACLLSKKPTVAAQSSGVAMRPTGISLRMVGNRSFIPARDIAVSTQPGAMPKS